MTEFALIETRTINNARVDGYYHDKEAWFTRYQIGLALGYEYPVEAVGRIHNRHRDRLNQFSRVSQIDTPSGVQEGYVYSRRGVLEICRWSRQPKADEVMDALYDMAESVLEKGYYSCMSDTDLFWMLVNKCLDNPSIESRLNKNFIGGMKKLRLNEEKENARDIIDDYNRQCEAILKKYKKCPSEDFNKEVESCTQDALKSIEELCPHLEIMGMRKSGIRIKQ